MRVGISHLLATTAAALFLALAALQPGAAQEAEASYVGDRVCKKCHFKQHKSWAKTKMAKSFDVLAPTDDSTDEGEELAEKKEEAGLDPEKDYRTDVKCLPCHTTGYGKPGGYPVKVTAENKKEAEKREGVQCESCHGPGSRYVPFFEKEENETYKRSELLKLGLVIPSKDTCVGCHNDESPFLPDDAFDFEEQKKKGTHDHVPLKHDHDG